MLAAVHLYMRGALKLPHVFISNVEAELPLDDSTFSFLAICSRNNVPDSHFACRVCKFVIGLIQTLGTRSQLYIYRWIRARLCLEGIKLLVVFSREWISM